MKKLISKAEVRVHLEREVTLFLDKGGQVEEIPRGRSGQDANYSLMPPSRKLFIEPSVTRTPIPEVVAAIEGRRKTGSQNSPTTKRTRLPRRRQKTIYDDFGEPLRRIWVDE